MSKIRVGIIGAGVRGIGTFAHLFHHAFGNSVEITAVADRNRERAEAGLAYVGVKADIHTEVEDLVARKDIDAVIVTTPDNVHEEHCVAAFRRGKHVLLDKPMATTAKGCLRIIEASRRAKKLLYMGHNMRHDPVINRMKALVAQGALGELFSAHAVEHLDSAKTYMARWSRLKKFSGGLWVQKGSHDFDVLNWLMGEHRPARVSSFASVFTLNPQHLPFKARKGVRPGPTCSACAYLAECPDARPTVLQPGRTSGDPIEPVVAKLYTPKIEAVDGYYRDRCMYLSDKDTHDQGIAIVEYDNGATAQHSEYFVTPISNREYTLEGTLGYGKADLNANRIEITRRWTKDRIAHSVRRDEGGHGGADPKMCAEFIACLRKGARPTASGADGAWSVAVGEAAEKSRVKARTIRISEVLDVKSSLLRG